MTRARILPDRKRGFDPLLIRSGMSPGQEWCNRGGAEMGAVVRQKWCKCCLWMTRHERQESMSGGMGCLLVILTGGLWLLVMIPYTLFLIVFPTYRCATCGQARGR